MIGEAWSIVTRTVGGLLGQGERWLFDGRKATYGLSVMRIALGLAVVGSLLANLTTRDYVWGPGSRWMAPYVGVDQWGFPFTAVFGETDGSVVFGVKYVVLIVVAMLFTMGWRTRIVTPVLLVMLTSLMRLAPLSTDAGDNLTRIVLLFLCFADIASVWSLDARRRRRQQDSPARLRPPEWFGTLLHNAALIAIAAQVFILYGTSGLSKVRGSMWQEGVGLYYPLQIGQYAAWPGLNEIVYTSGALVTIASYATVFVQVFFPLLLLRRGTRVVALVTVFLMHAGIAVMMALPWFSLAMLAADAIFIRNSTYRAVAAWLRRGRSRGPTDDPVVVRNPTSQPPTDQELPAGNIEEELSASGPGIGHDKSG